MACDISEPRQFQSHDSCQKRFLRTHKEVDLVLHPVLGLVLQERGAEKFPQAPGFEGLDPFLRVGEQGPCFTAMDDDEGDKKLLEVELACKADGVAPPDPVWSGHCCHC